MTTTDARPSRRKHAFLPEWGLLAAIFVLLALFLLAVLQNDQRDISLLADETTDFLETLCRRYDNYAAGQAASDLNVVLNKTRGLAEFAPDEMLCSQSYVAQYVSELELSGLLITDETLAPVAQADTSGCVPAELLAVVLNRPSVENILQYPSKVYSARLELNGEPYDVAVTARRDGTGLVAGYHRAAAGITDIYTASLEKSLEGNNFHKNPHIVITDGTTVIASNIDYAPAGTAVAELAIQDVSRHQCGFDGLIRLHSEHNIWYGKRQVYGQYYIYAFYPFAEVFNNMLPIVTSAIALYALLCMLMMLMRTRAEQHHLQTEQDQLRIIRTLSQLFAGATVLHLQEDTFDDISLAPRQADVPVGQTGIRQAYERLAAQLIAPEYRQPYLDFFDTATMEQRFESRDTLITIIQDNVGSWYSMYLLPLSRDGSGRLRDVLVASRNITEYKVKEEAYRAELRKTASDAQIASEAKSLFLRRMSHDVRTPINGIRGMAVLAQNSLDDPAAVRDCIEKIITSTDYLHELLEDVLRMSKLESGPVQFEDKPFDLSALIAETADFIRVQANEKQLTFTLDTSGLHHSRIIGSPMHLRQVMQNILSNAVKFTPSGGGIHAVCRETGCTGSTMQFEFVCSDTGVGISPEFRAKIFEPFAQEADSARTRYEGTGLGLPIAKEIVDQRGGTITVSSQKGCGSTFTVTLPLQLDTSCPEPPARPEAPASIAGAKILLAEDNEINRMVAQSLLEEQGAVITAVTDGRQAVDTFAASAPGSFDLILMDIMMPEMNGLEATRAIRAMDRSDAGSIPIFAMTANAFVEDIDACKKAGMNEHIAKPIDLGRMVQVIAEYYHKK